MDFSKRHLEEELMDDSQLPIENLSQTYADIARANRILGGDQTILRGISQLVLENPKERYSIIDVGCGDGDMLRKICQAFRQKGLKVRLTGIDLNENAIVLAKEASKTYPEIDFKVNDVLKANDNNLQADIVISTLTMHHIAEPQIPNFLKRLGEMAHSGVVINDLQRSRAAYYLFKLFSTIFIKTKIAKNDGLVSIRRGFVKKELLEYSKGLPKFDHSIRSIWAFRYVWIMQPDRLNQ